MALNPDDLLLNIEPINLDDQSIDCVIGHEASFKITVKNKSLTDAIYNVGVKLFLPDGLSYVSASLLENSNKVTDAFINEVSFIDIKDFYPNEQEFELLVTVTVNEHFSLSNLAVPYNYVFSNIKVSAFGDSMPRGHFDIGNIVLESESFFNLESLRYKCFVEFPREVIKGAGFLDDDSINATSVFSISIEIVNSTRDSSIISFSLNLGNGLRYLAGWTSTGTNSSNFANPIVTQPDILNNFVSIELTNKLLSQGSITQISFQAAIWNKYSINGIENSGDVILHKASILNTLSLIGNLTSYSYSFAIASLSLNFTHYTNALFTDVGTTNEYILTYSLSEYISISELELNLIVPNGMNYVENSSTIEPIVSNETNFTTKLSWIFTTLPENSDGFIILNLITDELYKPYDLSNFVYSTDVFVTLLEANYFLSESPGLIQEEAKFSIITKPPSIATTVESYHYSDLSPKGFSVATIGDYVRFKATYDASEVVAKQKNVLIFDYSPLNLDADTLTDIEIIGDFPESGTSNPVPNNGIEVTIGDLDGHSYFEFKFSIKATSGIVSSLIYNLMKCTLRNTENRSYSLRDSATIYFGVPHLKINQDISNSSNKLNYNKDITYNLSISNTSATYIADAFNLNLLATLPDLFTLNGVPTVSLGSNSSANALNIENNVLSLDIINLYPNETITITSNILVDTLPIMKKSYTINASSTNGTSQTDPNSHIYTENEYPLNSSLSMYGKSPSISKVYIPSETKVLDEYDVILTVTFPEGCLAYNTKIKDSLISTNSSNLNTVLLNGVPITPSLTTNNLTVPLEDITNTYAGDSIFVLKYTDKVLDITANGNFEQIIQTAPSVDWSEILAAPEIYSESTLGILKIVIPELQGVLMHRNTAESFSFDTSPILGKQDDLIEFNIDLSNIGKSTAFSILLLTTIPQNLSYISSNPLGEFNETTKSLSITLPNIETLGSTSVSIQARVNNDNSLLISKTLSNITFTRNSIPESLLIRRTTNLATLYSLDQDKVLTRFHRNKSIGEGFTKTTIRVFNGQLVENKLTISNPFNEPLSNIVITDVLSPHFEFDSYIEPSKGIVSIEGGIITLTASSLTIGESFDFIYTTQLNSPTITLDYSESIGLYEFSNVVNTFTTKSNRLFLRLSELGRGFSFY